MKWDFDYLLHFAGGLAVAIILSFGSPVWGPFLMIPILGAYGWLREKIQHSFKRLTTHQWIEAMTWPLGALVGSCVSLAWTL